MVSRFCFVFMFLTLMSVAGRSLAEVSVWVTPALVAPDQTITLHISSEIEKDEAPELSPLDKNFQVLSQKSSSSISMVEGKTTIKKVWDIVLLPLKKGKLEIPAIKVGNRFTIPLSVEVAETAKTTDSLKKYQQDIFIEVDAIPRNPYVQSQIVLTQKLYHAVPIEDATLTVPVTKGSRADIVKLADKPAYNQFINDRRYQVIERRFALFPKHSGELLIEAAVFKGRVSDGGKPKNLFDIFSGTRVEKATSKSLSIEVRSQNPLFQDHQWLPAKNVTLYANWSKPVSELKVGEPASLLLGIIADGLRAEQIPDIQFEVPHSINVYPELAEFTNNEANSGITGVWNRRITFIPSEVGEFTLPALKIPWWNVLNDREELAELEPFQLIVAEGSLNNSNALTGFLEQSKQDQKNSSRTWYLFVFTLLMVVSTWAVYRYWANGLRDKTGIAIPVRSESEVAKRQCLLAELKQACLSDDADTVLQLLPQWAYQIAHISPPTLSAIAAADFDGRLQLELNALSEAQYAKSAKPWKGAGLWDALNCFEVISKKPVRQHQTAAELEELYPHNV